MYRWLALLAVAAALGLVVFRLLPGASEPPFRGARLEDGEGPRILRLAGTAREKGRGHGEALRPEIRAALGRLRPAEEGVAEVAIRAGGEKLSRFLPEDLREEIEGIAEGAGITFHEALYLSTRFELAAFGLVREQSTWGGGGAVGPGPEVVLVLGEELAREAVVVVHADLDPPLVLWALPGMAGGFAGLRGDGAAALRPAPSAATTALSGLVWTLLLRRLVESPPRDVLPAPVTGHASVALLEPGGTAGTLSLGPAGAAWYAGGVLSATTEEPAADGGLRILLGTRGASAQAAVEERARALLAARGAGRVLLARRGNRVVAARGDGPEVGVLGP